MLEPSTSTSTHGITTSVASPEVRSGDLRRVLISGVLGQFVEWYDFVIYAYSTPIITKLFFPNINPTAALLSTLAVYAVGFLTRPIGALVWGSIGDRLGRRNTLSAIILMMGAATVTIGMLPTYVTIGVWAPALLVVCRLVQGLSAAGEGISASSFIAEHAPAHRRGFFTSIVYGSAVLPPIAAALLMLFLTRDLKPADFISWGWRLPFLLGAPMAIIGLYIRHKTEESPAFMQVRNAARVVKAPLTSTLRCYKLPMFFTFSIAALSSLAFFTMAGYFVTYLTTTVGIDTSSALISNSVALVVVFVAMLAGGFWSDALGRRNVMLFGAIATAVLCIPAYKVASYGSLPAAIAGQCLIALPLGVFLGPSAAAYAEFFPTRVRLSGGLFAYNLAYTIFGGTAQLLSAWLIVVTGNRLAPGYYMLFVAIIVIAILGTSPETGRNNLVRDEDKN